MGKIRLVLAAAVLTASLTAANAALAAGAESTANADAKWTARYWNNMELSGDPVLERQESEINHDWGDRRPADPVNRDQFSARWTRTVNFDAATYRFTATSDDGIRVWVDDRIVIDRWYDHPAETFTSDVSLTAGEHRVKVEYYENRGEAVAKLSWSKLGAPTAAWEGRYFNNRTLSGDPVVIRQDGDLNFDWGEGRPADGINRDGFSARWRRTVNFAPGTYRFTATSDDGIRVWIDDRQIIDRWYDHPAETYVVDVVVSAGEHRIRVDYYENLGLAVAKLSWSLLSAAAPNWRGEYFNNVALAGTPILVRDDSAINFDWGTGGPGGGVQSDLFSARWTRTANFDAATYRFTATSDDGIRVWVDDRLIIDRWYDHAAETFTADLPLTAGQHTIKVEFYENRGLAVAKVSWAVATAPPPSGVTATVTASALNIRSGPGIGYERIGVAFQGQTVTILGRNAAANWAYVDYRGLRGWMAAWYLRISGDFGSVPMTG